VKKRKHRGKTQAIATHAASKFPLFIIFIAVAAILLLLFFDPKTFSGGDNAHYMSLAQSILHGHYNVEAFISAPPEIGVTPGYPLILSVFLAVFGKTFMPAKILSFLCYLTAFWLWWRLFVRQGYDKRTVLLFLGFCVFNPIIAEYSHWELTEAPFILISTLALYCYFSAAKNNDRRYWILAGVVAACAFYVRAAGLTVSIAIGITLITQKKWRPLLYFSIPVIVLIIPWFIRMLIVSAEVGGGTYLPQFFSETSGSSVATGGFTGKFFRNFNRYTFVNLPALFLPIAEMTLFTNATLGYVLGGSITALILIGIVRLIKSEQRLYVVYVVCFMLVLYSYNEAAAVVRYMVVIAPFIALLLFKGTEYVCQAFKLRSSSVGAVFVMGMFLILSLPVYFQHIGPNVSMLSEYCGGNTYAGYHANFVRFIEAHKWLERYDHTDTGVISRKPRLTWWFSGHPAQEYVRDPDPRAVKADIDSSTAKYVIVDRISATTPRFLIPALQAFPESFGILHVTRPPETFVLEIIK
jgi:4-amino-4-deoxy-L-arabinose transferase-like glycosyltransferase